MYSNLHNKLTCTIKHTLSCFFYVCCNVQGTHGTGKAGKMAKKNPCQGKHREFGNFAKTQGIWFAQVVSSLFLMVKDISKFATKISKLF